MDSAPNIFLSLILATACVTDLRSQRIPNWLTYPAMCLALGLHGVLSGADGLLFSISGLGAGLGLMILPFLMGVMGAGDVKLLAAAGAFIGARDVLSAFILTSLLGGVYALVVMIFHRRTLAVRLRALKEAAMLAAAGGGFSLNLPEEGERLPRLCYGLAIAAGCWARMLLAVYAPNSMLAG